MEEKRLECLMMLQVHRSDTLSIDGVLQLLTDLTPLQHGDLIFYYEHTCTSVHCTVQ